jgi:tetratricopeptide (TPR) repeat protein
MRGWLNFSLPVLLLSLAGLGLGGCPRRMSGGPKTARPVSALPGSAAGREAFEAGQKAYLEKRYSDTIELMSRYAQTDPGGAMGAEALYWRGMSRLALGEIVSARDDLLRVKATRRIPRWLQALAQRGIARCYQAEGDYRNAEAAYKRLLYLYPEDSDSVETLHAMAECARLRGDAASAAQYERELAMQKPATPLRKPVGRWKNSGTEASPPPAAQVRFVVQAGVFSDRTGAARLVARLRRKNLESIIIRQTTGRQTRYIVQAGSFTTRTGARRRAGELKKNGFDAIVKP